MWNIVTAWVQSNRILSAVIAAVVAYIVTNRQTILQTILANVGTRIAVARKPETETYDMNHAAFVPLDLGGDVDPYTPDRATMFTWLDNIRSHAIAAGNTQAVATTNKLINDLFTFDPKPVDVPPVNPSVTVPLSPAGKS